MFCPNCQKEGEKLVYVTEETAEGRKTFIYCNRCPKPKVEPLAFPAIITGKRGRGRPAKHVVLEEDRIDTQERAASVALATEADRVRAKEYQRLKRKHHLRGNPVDTAERRARDDIKNLNNRHSVILMGDCPKEKMQGLLNKKMDAKFGSGNWRITKNDGVTITAQPVGVGG